MTRSFISKRSAFQSSVVAVAVLSVGALVQCGSSTEGAVTDATSEPTTTAEEAASATKPVSFLVASDLHFGYGVDPAGYEAADEEDGVLDDDEIDDDADASDAATAANPRGGIYLRNQALAAAMMATTTAAGGKALAKNGITNDFAGVIVTGDIADNGQPQQWADFFHVFGFDGSGSFTLPVYETWGNHDYPWTTKTKYPYDSPHDIYDLDRIDHRNGVGRSGFIDESKYSKNDSGIFAWHVGHVLFVNLGLKASDAANDYQSNVVDGPNHHFRYTNPFRSLTFLKTVLDHNASAKTPIVLSFHYPMVAGDNRMTDKERNDLYAAIQGYNVVAILHGHRHISTTYQWCGIPVLEVGTPRNVRSDKDSSFVAMSIGADTLDAQTVHYRQGGASTVGYDTGAGSCDLMRKDKGDTCWKVHAKLPIKVTPHCKTDVEVH